MKASRTQIIRRVVQVTALAASLAWLVLTILGGRQIIHQACPYALVCFGLSGSNFLRLGNLAMSGAVIFGFAVLVYSMFYGRRFCAYLCPLGSAQEFVYLLRGRKYRVKHRTPYYMDRKLAWLKYLILLATVMLTAIGLNYIFIRLCPFYGLSLLGRLVAPGVAVMALILLKAFFGDREWCRFLCPYAALMNIFQWLGEMVGIRRRKIRRNLERCTDCGVCMLYCPMNINIAESEYVHNRNCIHCGLCADHCPKPGTYSEECECEQQ